MTTRVYILITVLLGILTFNLSEAGIMDPSTGAQVGPPSRSVTIPVKNNPGITQRLAVRFEVVGSSLKKTESNGDSTSGSSKFPQKDANQQTKPGKTQPGNQGAIFDRWGN